jgi:hypothetical protein
LPSTHPPVANAVSVAPRTQDLTDLLHQPGLRERAGAVAGLAVTIGVLACVAAAFGRLHVAELFANLPTSAGFWALLAAAYLLAPMLEWIILRRLWRLGAAGFAPLLRKQVANELLLGYSGDAQFYLWARTAMPAQAAPFATLRDMSILSALAGNLATLVLMVLAYPTISHFANGPLLRGAVLATLVIVVSSLGIFAARRAFFDFSLSRRAIAGVFLGHMARIVAMLVLSACLWAALIPGATLGTLMVLGTMRMMLSRVPLIPGKDALFAGGALALMGSDMNIAGALATIAALMIGLHALVGLVTGVEDVLRRSRR